MRYKLILILQIYIQATHPEVAGAGIVATHHAAVQRLRSLDDELSSLVGQLRVVHHIVHLEPVAERVFAHAHEEECVG